MNYLVGDQTYTVSHFDQPYYVLGYLPRDGRVYICDKDVAVTSFALSLSVIEYQTLVLRGDLDSANEMLADIPDDQKNKIARFLEGQGYKEQALEVATDAEHRFDLALALGQLTICLDLARSADVPHKWQTVGDTALASWDMKLAEECYRNSKDLGSLLLLHTSSCDESGLRSLAAQAREAGQHNVSFTCLWQLADLDGCIDLLMETNRTAEAVLFAQTYKPSRAPAIVAAWKAGLEKNGKTKVSRMLSMPGEDEEMFPEWDDWLNLEKDGGRKADLIDVGDDGREEATNGVDIPDAKAQAAPVDADGKEEGESPQTETEV